MPLTYEGGVGADTIFVGGAVNSSTVYGDNSSTTEAGDDSISISGALVRGYGNVGDIPSPSLVVLSLVPSMAEAARIPSHNPETVHAAALIDGEVGNDFLSLGGLSGTSSLFGGAGEDTITVAGKANQWLIDAGDDGDSLYITNAAERTTVGGDG